MSIDCDCSELMKLLTSIVKQLGKTMILENEKRDSNIDVRVPFLDMIKVRIFDRPAKK